MGTIPTLPLSPQLLSAPGWSVDRRRAAPSGLGAVPGGVGSHPRVRLAWPERRAAVTDNRARRQPSSHRQ